MNSRINRVASEIIRFSLSLIATGMVLLLLVLPYIAIDALAGRIWLRVVLSCVYGGVMITGAIVLQARFDRTQPTKPKANKDDAPNSESAGAPSD